MENHTPHNNLQQIVVVLGMHRSGTSALTRGLQACGVALGEEHEPAAAGINDKGYWEDVDFVRLNEEMLHHCGMAWHSVSPVSASDVEKLCANGFLHRATDLLRRKSAGHVRFGFKDPRTAKMLPFWVRVFAHGGFDVRYIIAIRNPLSVVQSLSRRDQFPPTKSYLTWVDHVLTSLLHSDPAHTIIVDFDFLMGHPAAELQRIAALLGADLNEQEVKLYCDDFLDQSLRHSTFGPDDVDRDNSAIPLAADIYRFLLEVAASRENINSDRYRAKLVQWQTEFDRLRTLLAMTDIQFARNVELQTQMSIQTDQTETILEEYQQQIYALNLAQDELTHQVNYLSELVRHTQSELAYSRQTVAAMLNSYSWRITAPVRFVTFNLRRVVRTARLMQMSVRQAGGLTRAASRLMAVLASGGLSGLRRRMREMEAASHQVPAAQLAIPVATSNTLRVVPVYIDPKLDTVAPQALPSFTLAVHLFVNSVDGLTSLVRYLRNVPVTFDLFISLSDQLDPERVRSQIGDGVLRARTIDIQRSGSPSKDVARLLEQFGSTLQQYRIVGHFNDLQPDCMDETLDRLLGAEGTTGGGLAHQLDDMLRDTAMVYAEPPFGVTPGSTDTADMVALVRKLQAQLPAPVVTVPDDTDFPLPAMFWIHGACLRHMVSLPLTANDFAKPDLNDALARLLPICAGGQGGVVKRVHRRDTIEDFQYYEPQRDYSAAAAKSDIKVLAYYLPQFHPIPENDEWHGKGFTEWTKVRAANPLFEGHYQQHIPHPDIGYYLLDSPDTLRKQASLMKKSGVHGQIFYHYWFGGKLILEEPVRMLLDTPDIDMPFCFCWANENWTRRWDGNEREILLGQNYSQADARAFIQYLIPFFRDARYLRIDNRPVLYVYRPSSIPDIRGYIEAWQDECSKANLPAPYVVAVLTRGATDPADFGMDAGTERVLHDWTDGAVPNVKHELPAYAPVNGSVLRYSEVAKFYAGQTDVKPFTYFRSLVPIWDNTARYGSEAFVVHDSTPELFQHWLATLIDYSRQHLPADRRFIVVNAWNEWAEGAHLEPDTRFGYSYLNAIGRALSGKAYQDENAAVLPPVGSRHVHLATTPAFRQQLAVDANLAARFFHSLRQASIFTRHTVSVDPALAQVNLPTARIGDADAGSMVIEFRRVAFFADDVLEKMLQGALANPASAVVPNTYADRHTLASVTSTGAVARHELDYASMVATATQPDWHAIKNVRMCTDGWSFAAEPDRAGTSGLAAVTTIIRVHKSADFKLLRNALSCLVAMHHCICQPLIAAQDLSEDQHARLTRLLGEFPWHPDHPPRVQRFESPDGNGDLRSKMLNESLRSVTTRYAAFLDYDDLLMPSAYEWLIRRLQISGRAVSFGRVFSSAFNSERQLLLDRSRAFEYGYSYQEFVDHNHAPLHSFMLDLHKLDLTRIVYFDDQRYMEDYLLTLQLFTRQNCDWAGLRANHYIGDYVHSVDREHTLAISNDSARTALSRTSAYRDCEAKINEIRAKLINS